MIEQNFASTSVQLVASTCLSAVRFIIRSNGLKVLCEPDKTIFKNTGDFEKLTIFQKIRTIARSTRSKLSTVPESIEVLQERKNWIEWDHFKNTVDYGVHLKNDTAYS